MLTRGDPDNSQWRGDDGPQRYSEAEEVEDARYRLRTIKGGMYHLQANDCLS